LKFWIDKADINLLQDCDLNCQALVPIFFCVMSCRAPN
jgi:hypothetical protein